MHDSSEHVGLPLLSAEREKLLAEYEIALKQVADDPVKVDHGNVGEAALRRALGALGPFWQENPMVQFIGALIIRGQSHLDCSASADYLLTSSDLSIENMLNPACETSPPFVSFVSEMTGYIVSGGFGRNEFWRWMIDFVHALNGNDNEYCPPSKMTGGYGESKNSHECHRLFPK